MILRKPTRIQLKPQQDSQQYQDFKLKLSQAGKIKKPIESTFKTNVLGSIKTTTKNSRIMSSETRSYFPEMFSRFPMAGEDSPERMDRFGGRREEREREGESGSGGHSIYSMNPEGEYSGDGRFMM